LHWALQESNTNIVGQLIGNVFNNTLNKVEAQANNGASLISLEDNQKLTVLNDATLIVEGLLVGVFEQHFSDVGSCITDAESIFNDLESAVSSFQNNDYYSFLESLGSGVEATYNAVKACGAIEGDFTKLGQIAAIYSNPASATLEIGVNIIFNGYNIYSDLSNAVSNWDYDYYQFGVDVGKAGDLIVIGTTLGDPFIHPASRAKMIANNMVPISHSKDITVTKGPYAFKMILDGVQSLASD